STRTAERNLVPPCTTRCPTASTPAISSFASSDRTFRSIPLRLVASTPSDTSALAIAASSTLSTTLPFNELEPTFRTRTRMRLLSLPVRGGTGWGRLVGPGPVAHVRHVFPVVPGVLAMPQALVHHMLPDVPGAR